MSKAMIICISLLAACATGGSNGEGTGGNADAGTQIRQDALLTTTDAAVRLDGGNVTPTPDAAVSQTPDAGSSGPFCTANNQCTTAGECCVTLGGPQGFCAPGDVILGQCFPQ